MTGVENCAPTEFGSPDRPVHSKSLYRLTYRGLHYFLHFYDPCYEKKILVQTTVIFFLSKGDAVCFFEIEIDILNIFDEYFGIRSLNVSVWRSRCFRRQMQLPEDVYV